MTARTLLNATLAMFLTSTVLMAAGLIWLAAAEPALLVSAQSERGVAGIALTVAARALSVLW